jgi:hypothetical protein
METETKTETNPEVLPWWAGRTSGSYDPMHPANVEARKYDDNSSGIDWEEIMLTTQEDYEAGRYSFNSQDYATHEEAMAAMRALIHSIAEEVEREAASLSPRSVEG